MSNPLCLKCGQQLARSFTKGDYVCLPCNRTYEAKDVAPFDVAKLADLLSGTKKS